MALAPNDAYALLQKRNPKMAPNTAYGKFNPGTTLPGGTPPAQTDAAPPPSGGGGGSKPPVGSSVPYAGVYAERQNEAERAYEGAQQQLLAQRNTLYHKYGLTNDGAVDPYNRYGDYQMLLGREGSDLDAARESALGRGLGGSGLARQGESALRFQDGAEQLAFQNQVLGVDSDYRSGLASALGNKNSAFLQAEQDANDQALQELLANGQWTDAGGGGGGNNSTPPPPGPNTSSKPPVDPKYPALAGGMTKRGQDAYGATLNAIAAAYQKMNTTGVKPKTKARAV